jgi:membrane protein required for colicin V production
MNGFDAAVLVALVVAVATGFNAGLLRSAVTILAYLIAMPITVWVMTLIATTVDRQSGVAPWSQNLLLFFAIFFVAGAALGKTMRMMLDDAVGPSVGIGDRLAGASLGAVRVGLLAVTMVLVFDQLVPSYRQPEWLAGSQLRPLLSAAGQRGFRSLPPDITAYIDRLKRDRQI